MSDEALKIVKEKLKDIEFGSATIKKSGDRRIFVEITEQIQIENKKKDNPKGQKKSYFG